MTVLLFHTTAHEILETVSREKHTSAASSVPLSVWRENNLTVFPLWKGTYQWQKKILNITRCRKAAIGMFNIIDMI